jgi:hypothetical protein
MATLAMILVDDITLKDAAAVPPKLTDVAPVKLVPVMVTTVSFPPEVGVKEVMVGGRINVNPDREPVPYWVATLMLPDVPFATVAIILVADTTLKDVASVPPNLTPVVPVKLFPVMDTVVPSPPDFGVKDVIAGGGRKVNPASDAVPPGVVTLMFPDFPEPTTAVMIVGETIEYDAAAIPPKLTEETSVKFVPVMVMVESIAPVDGVKELMVGGGIMVFLSTAKV